MFVLLKSKMTFYKSTLMLYIGFFLVLLNISISHYIYKVLYISLKHFGSKSSLGDAAGSDFLSRFISYINYHIENCQIFFLQGRKFDSNFLESHRNRTLCLRTYNQSFRHRFFSNDFFLRHQASHGK
jgi:hypothetical protein